MVTAHTHPSTCYAGSSICMRAGCSRLHPRQEHAGANGRQLGAVLWGLREHSVANSRTVEPPLLARLYKPHRPASSAPHQCLRHCTRLSNPLLPAPHSCLAMETTSTLEVPYLAPKQLPLLLTSHTMTPPVFSSDDASEDYEEEDAPAAPSPAPVPPSPPAAAPNASARPPADDPQLHNNGQFRGRPSLCVFVALLLLLLLDDHLCLLVTEHFAKWGTLAMVKVLRDTHNRPYAFVQYTTDADAKIAIKQAQHLVLDGRSIRCEHARVNRTLYVCPDDLIRTEEVLLHIMRQYGEVEQFLAHAPSKPRYPWNTKTGSKTASKDNEVRSAYFCKYAYRDDAIRAYASLRTELDWVVEWAQNLELPDDPTESVTIDKLLVFVGQLSPEVLKDMLLERFLRHGQVAEAVLVQRPNNTCFAFVKFLHEALAAAAVERENHAIFHDRTMHVQYREMHHNTHRRSGENRLSLAPPPINLPHRRALTGLGLRSSHLGSSSRQRRLTDNQGPSRWNLFRSWPSGALWNSLRVASRKNMYLEYPLESFRYTDMTPEAEDDGEEETPVVGSSLEDGDNEASTAGASTVRDNGSTHAGDQALLALTELAGLATRDLEGAGTKLAYLATTAASDHDSRKSRAASRSGRWPPTFVPGAQAQGMMMGHPHGVPFFYYVPTKDMFAAPMGGLIPQFYYPPVPHSSYGGVYEPEYTKVGMSPYYMYYQPRPEQTPAVDAGSEEVTEAKDLRSLAEADDVDETEV